MAKLFHASGKRKAAIARATVKEGKGEVRINSILLDNYSPSLAREKIREPLYIAGDEIVKGIKVDVNVRGGGWLGRQKLQGWLLQEL